MKKIYVVEKAKNGFIIKFDHLKLAFETEKLCVAKTLDEVIEILREDINKEDVETKKASTETSDTLLAQKV